ncbi:MAG: hypothetical protein PHX46_03945 [Bacilli bacterium]|nr:hypothetical protein [Bacilli bacterium]
MGNVYQQDNAAYRQRILNMLEAIRNEVAGIDGLKAENLKSGVKLLGFTGTYTDEAINAATALDIAEGKIAYINGVKIVGVAGISEYALTVDETGTGTGTGSVTVDGDAYAAPVDYVAGSEVELVATPDAGSIFVNWTVGGVEVSTEATFAYTTTKAAVTVVANFNLS